MHHIENESEANTFVFRRSYLFEPSVLEVICNTNQILLLESLFQEF